MEHSSHRVSPLPWSRFTGGCGVVGCGNAGAVRRMGGGREDAGALRLTLARKVVMHEKRSAFLEEDLLSFNDVQ